MVASFPRGPADANSLRRKQTFVREDQVFSQKIESPGLSAKSLSLGNEKPTAYVLKGLGLRASSF